MAESKVIKSGNLSLQSKGLMKSWAKKFCVLHGGSIDSHPYMELFDDYDTFKRMKENPRPKDEAKRIDLHNVKTIKTSSKGKNEFIIDIRNKKNKFMLMVDCRTESMDWLNKLNLTAVFSGSTEENSTSQEGTSTQPDMDDADDITINPMYDSTDQATRFEVEVQESPLARICGVVGKKTLLISNSAFAFQDLYTKEINYNFPFIVIRRFGKKENTLSVEIGRKCLNGEGSLSMVSDFSKTIHEVLTSSARSTSSGSIKSASFDSKSSEKRQSGPVSEMSGDANISAPTLALNMQRCHPGQKSLPVIPLKPKPEYDDNQATDHNRNSKESTDQRSSSVKVSENWRKELEVKLQSGPPDHQHKFKKDSKSKKEEKKEKHDKFERNEKDHDEKKHSKLKLFSKKDKKEEQKDADKGKDKPEKGSSRRREVRNEYEDPDADFKNSHPVNNGDENLYDEPILSGKPETKKAEHKSRKSKKSDAFAEAAYDNKGTVEPVEYAQPVKPKATKTAGGAMYSDVQIASGEAWKSLGRTEDEEHHSEQYSSLQSAREQMQNAPPPVPFRQYDVDEEEDDDDTYNRVNLRESFGSKYKMTAPEDHIYGKASGPIGELPDKVLVPKPDYDSDSEGEAVYDDLEYDVCGNAEESRKAATGGGSEYEEAVIPSPPKNSPPRTKAVKVQQEGLYEDVR